MDGPEELELPKAFANTVDVEDGVDELASTDALTAWLAGRGLLPPGGPPATADDLALARRLRAGLRAAIAGHHDGDVPEAARAELDELARALPLRVDFAAAEPRLATLGGGPRGALARVVADVVLAQCRGTWDRLKICPADDCAWVFYDQSKNRSRRWCSMGVCGNRTKVRAYRARTRA